MSGRLVIGTRRYSSWSMRGWLAVRLAGLTVEEIVIPLTGGAISAVKDATPTGLVPYLEHDGACIAESLAIVEYCAEFAPLWPTDRIARAAARAAAAEMHAGFAALRSAMPMNLGAMRPGIGRTPAALADIARIEALWHSARPFLWGPTFGAADAMFAPVVARFLSYQPVLSAPAQAYCRAVRAHKLVEEWYRLAADEPESWRLEKYEGLLF